MTSGTRRIRQAAGFVVLLAAFNTFAAYAFDGNPEHQRIGVIPVWAIGGPITVASLAVYVYLWVLAVREQRAEIAIGLYGGAGRESLDWFASLSFLVFCSGQCLGFFLSPNPFWVRSVSLCGCLLMGIGGLHYLRRSVKRFGESEYRRGQQEGRPIVDEDKMNIR